MAIASFEQDIQQAAPGCRERKADAPEQFSLPSINEFESLYVSYRPRVWSLCLRMTGNPDDAEDLTQETFVRLFQKLDTFRGDSAFCTWLRRIAINVVLLRFQKASRRHETSMEALAALDTTTGRPHQMEFGGFDPSLMSAIDRITLQRAIDQLPPGFRAVLILHDIQGYEHVEISELMGCSIGTSKSQLHKARLKMREMLRQTPSGQPRVFRQTAARMPVASSAWNQMPLQFPHTAPPRYSAFAA